MPAEFLEVFSTVLAIKWIHTVANIRSYALAPVQAWFITMRNTSFLYICIFEPWELPIPIFTGHFFPYVSSGKLVSSCAYYKVAWTAMVFIWSVIIRLNLAEGRLKIATFSSMRDQQIGKLINCFLGSLFGSNKLTFSYSKCFYSKFL